MVQKIVLSLQHQTNKQQFKQWGQHLKFCIKTMTKQEFTERTKVEVKDSEFETINALYMDCECDKDEFCKMWCKMNPVRVSKAKAVRKIEERDNAYKDALRKFFDKTKAEDQFIAISYVKMSVFEIQAMSYAGIDLENECGSELKNVMDIRHEIRKYLGM